MRRPIYLKAEFMGDMSRFPFSNNSVYNIVVLQERRSRIHVQVCQNNTYVPLEEYAHRFQNLLEFFRVWKVVGVDMGGSNGFYRVDKPDEII